MAMNQQAYTYFNNISDGWFGQQMQPGGGGTFGQVYGQPGEALPSTAGYTPGGAPGYGTSMNPEYAGFNLFGDAREWLRANPQIWEQYGGQMSAGLSPLHGAATEVAQNAANYQPQQVQAGSFLGGPGIGAYMNPYTDQVVNTAMGDIERSRQIANQQGARSAGAGTYGGDRNALIEAETNRAYADTAARTSAQLRSQGFDTAAGLYGQDLSRGLTAGLANQQAGLAGAGLGLQGAGVLAGLGQQEQMTNQADLTNRYNEYIRSTYGPMSGYNFLGGLLNGAGYQPQGSNPGAGFAGGALAGASIGAGFGGIGAIPGWAIGGLLGGGLGLF